MVTHRTNIYGKASQNVEAFIANITQELVTIQRTLFGQALTYRNERIRTDITDFEAFKDYFKTDDVNTSGFVRAYWCESAESEASLKELAVTIRCLPYDQPEEPGTCVITGNPATKVAIFAKAY